MKHKIESVILAAGAAVILPFSANAADTFAAAPMVDAGWYARGELGASWLPENRGYWQRGTGDPRITFDLDNTLGFTGAVAVGKEFKPGVRGDISFGYTDGHGIDANWISASDGSPGPHADIDAGVSAVTGMANIFLEPLAMSGNDGPIQPFFTAGIGAAIAHMDELTRYNSAATQPVRRWGANNRLNFAWTVGGGISADAEQVFNRPAFLDVTYRYSDYGKVEGGTNPTFPGPPPSNSPTEPFNFHYRTHSVTVGLRFPFNP